VGHAGALLPYHRYTYNPSRSQVELTRMIRAKVFWIKMANVLFALVTVVLAALLIVMVWKV